MSTYTVIVEQSDFDVSVTGEKHIIIETGVQGPPGILGIARAIVQDSEPLVGTEGDLWFNDSTEILKVYANDAWQTQTIDDQYF